MNNEKFEKGLTLRRELSGDEVVDVAFKDPNDWRALEAGVSRVEAQEGLMRWRVAVTLLRPEIEDYCRPMIYD